jgi:hypothetical protein
MSDSLPTLARAGVARMPLDPTQVVPGPQPLQATARDEHHVIVGEVLNKGRHRAPGRGRRIAVSSAVLSAAGAFVTLALLTNHGSTSAEASPRTTPRTPAPTVPDEPSATAHPVHTRAAPARHATPAAVSRTGYTGAPSPAARTAASQWQRQAAAEAAEMRQAAERGAQAWAGAMSRGYEQSGRREQAGPDERRAAERQAAERAAEHRGAGYGHGRGSGYRHGHPGR